MITPGRNSNLVDYDEAVSGSVDAPVMTRRSDAFVSELGNRLEAIAPEDIAERIRVLARKADAQRTHQCLNLNAAENTTSRRTRELLNSDLATRVTEGFPGDKEFPPPQQNAIIDEIEGTLLHLVRRLFDVPYAEWRAVSTSMAFAIMLQATTRPGDTILVQSMEGGGSMTYSPDGAPGLWGVRVIEIPPDDEFDISPDQVRALADEHKPRLIVVGGSYNLFPPNLRALRDVADACGALLVYDAAHVSLYGATGLAVNPFSQGVHLMCASTHKILGGPVGGLVLTPYEQIARSLMPIAFPAFLQTRDQNKLAATAHALAEMVAFGAEYARQTVVNARALAQELEMRGYNVLARDRRWTETHQIFVDLGIAGSRMAEVRCQDAGLFLHAAHLRGDTKRGMRTGLRITTQEVTRRGMKEREMRQIVALIDQAIRGTSTSLQIAEQVETLASAFPGIAYSFDNDGDVASIKDIRQ